MYDFQIDLNRESSENIREVITYIDNYKYNKSDNCIATKSFLFKDYR